MGRRNKTMDIRIVMAILEMIPAEYWRQLRQELNALDWVAIDAEEEAKRQAKRAKLEKAYNEAIRKRELKLRRANNARNNARRKGLDRKSVV